MGVIKRRLENNIWYSDDNNHWIIISNLNYNNKLFITKNNDISSRIIYTFKPINSYKPHPIVSEYFNIEEYHYDE